MLTKTCLIDVKLVDEEAGTFVALASVFGNVDLVGDRVVKGAFKNTLKRWQKSGDPIPIVLSHKWDDPHAHIGVADPMDVRETREGLEVKGTLDVMDNAVAAQVYKLMKRRSLKAFSFGYTVQDERLIEEDGKYVNELLDVDLVEVGPTLKGANPEAGLQEIKSALHDQNHPPVDRKDDDPGADDDPPPPDEEEDETSDDEDPSAVDDRGGDNPPPKRQDPLRKQTDWARLEAALGRSPYYPPAVALEQEEKAEEPEPPTERELRRQTEKMALDMALGG